MTTFYVDGIGKVTIIKSPEVQVLELRHELGVAHQMLDSWAHEYRLQSERYQSVQDRLRRELRANHALQEQIDKLTSGISKIRELCTSARTPITRVYAMFWGFDEPTLTVADVEAALEGVPC